MSRLLALFSAVGALAVGCWGCALQREAQRPTTAALAPLPKPLSDAKTASYEEVVPPVLQEPDTLPDSSQDASILADFESQALANNPALAEAEAEVRAAQGKWLQVGLRPNPVVGYSAQEMNDEGSAGKQGAFFGQKFITAGKLQRRREVAAREIELAEQRVEAQRLRVLTDVRSAYNNALMAQERVATAQAIADLAERAAESNRELLDAQQATRIDLLQAEIEAESNRVLVETAEADRSAAWRKLAVVAGKPDMPIVYVEGDLVLPPETPDWEATLQRILAESPEVAAASIGVAQARSKLRQAQAEGVPDVETSVTVAYDDATQDTITSVQFGLPLPIYNRNQGGIRQARAEVTAADRNRARVELSLEQRLAAVYQRLTAAQLQATRYHGVLLPKAEETLRLVTTGYEAGELPYLSLLTVQRTYFQTALLYLEALREAWAAYYEIEGLLLSNSLTTPAQ